MGWGNYFRFLGRGNGEGGVNGLSHESLSTVIKGAFKDTKRTEPEIKF